MQIHPRERIVSAAEFKIRTAVLEATRELTSLERLSVVTQVLSDITSTICKYQIRQERHGNTDEPGGIAVESPSAEAHPPIDAAEAESLIVYIKVERNMLCVCVSADMPRNTIETRTYEPYEPRSGRWRISESGFNAGDLNPCVCDRDDTRLHYFLRR